jgi:hypothetical protein
MALQLNIVITEDTYLVCYKLVKSGLIYNTNVTTIICGDYIGLKRVKYMNSIELLE